MRTLAVVDTSALFAAADRSEPMHQACVDVLRRPDLDLIIPVMVVAEAAYLVEQRLGPAAETAFIRGLSGFAIESPTADDWPTIADVVERYADLRLGTTDASIAVLADRLGTDVVVTLDRRHFDVIRTASGGAFHVLPRTSAVHEDPATSYSGSLADVYGDATEALDDERLSWSDRGGYGARHRQSLAGGLQDKVGRTAPDESWDVLRQAAWETQDPDRPA